MSEDAKIDAIVSLHEHNIAKDKRIAELEESLKFAQLERDNRTSAYEVGVKIIGEHKERIAELERREKYNNSVLNEIAERCLGVRKYGTYVPDTMADEIEEKLNCIAELERQLAEAQMALHASASLNADLDRQLAEAKSKADGYANTLYQINLKLQPDKDARELLRVEDAAEDVMRQLAEAKIDSDWLIDHNAMVIYGGKILSGKARHGFWVSWPGGEHRQLGIYETAREAIDAARKGRG